MSTAERPDDDLLFVERVVDMASELAKVDAAKARHTGGRISRASSGKER